MSDAPQPSPGREGKPRHLLGKLPEELKEHLLSLGEQPFRAKQLFRWMHHKGVLDVDAMTDLPQALRLKLVAQGWQAPIQVTKVHRSQDGTRKLLVSMPDGGQVECVLIPMTDLEREDEVEEEQEEDAALRRVTLCVSSQIGCAMGCVFCASGQAGLQRGLTAAEIVAQVIIARRYLDPGENLRNLVFMGMGEPLHHYAETERAIRLITHQEGLGMSPRRLTVSTVGLVPGIRKLGEDFGGKVGLAISLHASNGTLRSEIIPMNDRYPFEELLRALRDYPLPKRRRITIEYTLLGGKNDSIGHAEELARALRGLAVKVNLIPVNQIEGGEYATPSVDVVDQFRRRLGDLRVSCSVRQRRGDDVAAACGQLALQEQLIQVTRRRASAEP